MLAQLLLIIMLFCIISIQCSTENFQEFCTSEMKTDPITICKRKDICCSKDNPNCFCNNKIITDCYALKKLCEDKMCRYTSREKCNELCGHIKDKCCEHIGTILSAKAIPKFKNPIQSINTNHICNYGGELTSAELCAKMCLYHKPKCTGFSIRNLGQFPPSPKICQLYSTNDTIQSSKVKTDLYYSKK